uniref:Arylesterase n=1 Tax=Parastrongyloides trichosuri TaxID=131310 RepID=A0A0N4ZH65_PARTI
MGKYKMFKKKEKEEKKEENNILNRKARRDVFEDKKNKKKENNNNDNNNETICLNNNKPIIKKQKTFYGLYEKLILTCIFSVFASWLIRWILILDTNHHVHPHHPLSCYQGSLKEPLVSMMVVDEIEMILYFTEKGQVYGSEFEKKDLINEIAMDWKKETEKRLKIKSATYYGINFKVYFYVVNEKIYNDEIVVFVWDQKYSRIIYNSRFMIPQIPRISSLGAIGFNRLYIVSSFHFSDNSLMKIIEILSSIKYGSLYFYDGKEAKKIINGLSYPKDVVIDNKRNRLFIGEVIGRSIKAYNIKPDFNIEESSDINTILSSPNKLFIDKNTGDVWCISYIYLWKKIYNLLSTINNSSNKTFDGERKVHRIRFQDENMKTWITTEPFADNGNYFPYANDISIYDDQLILTSNTNGVLYCPKLNMKII